jgi:hypothetical protein
LSDLRVAAALFVAVLGVHGLSPNLNPFDSRWVVFSSLSLLHHGDLDLNEYRPAVEASGYYLIECVKPGGSHVLLAFQPEEVQRACHDRLYHHYPLAVPVFAAPVVWVVEKLSAPARPVLEAIARKAGHRAPLFLAWASGDLASIAMFVDFGVACFFVALATVLVYFMCREDLAPAWSAALALVFAFATPAWSIGSRALWQHTLSMPLLALVLWLLSAARRRPSLAAWAGLPLMAAFWVRPTNTVVLGTFSMYVLVFYRRQFGAFLAAMIPPAVLFGVVTYTIYGSPIAPVAGPGRVAEELGLHADFWQALAANLWSPARGVIVFMPFVLLILFVPPCAAVGGARRWLHWAGIAAVAAQLVLVSSFIVWWGGHHFGPRYLSDLCPVFVFLSIPLVSSFAEGRRGLMPVMLLLLAYGAFVHWRGASTPEVLRWNSEPVNIDQAPWRVWDWSDLPFLRGLGE